jgi:murein tripeptide amidase MpaA
MPKVRFDHYYRYDELVRILRRLAREFPNLVRLESLGTSHEGRHVWLATVTNFQTGPDTDKPAVWVDGNIHAAELSASSACVYHLYTLTSQYGKDADITRCLDTRVFYICPRVNPDGAEWALADRPKFIRSSTRPYPYLDEPLDGLFEEDIDGDGRILTMRIPDPNGIWKPHPDDPRLMIRRDPAEAGGTYYRLLTEGFLKDYDGVTIQTRAPKEGLDLNRNFSAGWRPENDQPGAGPFPASEPETRNLVEFIVKHPNITSAIAFHTFSGVLLRPYDDRADDEFPAEDLWTFQKIGEKGTSLTGYPHISIFHDFRYHPKKVTTGGFDTWAYEHRGAFAWTVEIWSPQRQAGIEKIKYIDWFREHAVEDDLKLIKWNDEKLGGQGHVDWYPFEHPQLGKVELGGWDMIFAWANPPREALENEIRLFPPWLVWQALISPLLSVHEASAVKLDARTYRVRLVVENTGWLPTYVTKKGLERKVARGVICEIELPRGATLRSGKARQECAQLEGRAYKSATLDSSEESTHERLKVEWVVHAPRGGKVKLSARHDRVGVVRAQVVLK